MFECDWLYCEFDSCEQLVLIWRSKRFGSVAICLIERNVCSKGFVLWSASNVLLVVVFGRLWFDGNGSM
jgi:hypothetical protein